MRQQPQQAASEPELVTTVKPRRLGRSRSWVELTGVQPDNGHFHCRIVLHTSSTSRFTDLKVRLQTDKRQQYQRIVEFQKLLECEELNTDT